MADASLNSQPDAGPVEQRPVPGLLLGFGASIVLVGLAAVLTWYVLEKNLPAFEIPKELQNPPSPTPVDLAQKIQVAMTDAERKDGLLTFACIGAVAAAALAIGEGLQRGRWVRTAIGLTAGTLAAGLLGACGACTAFETSRWLAATDRAVELQLAISMHAIGWGVLGLGLGLAVALLTGSPTTAMRSAVGGAVGGAIMGSVFPLVAASIWPIVDTEQQIPEAGAVRLVWLAGGLSLATLGLVLMGRSPGGTAEQPAERNDERSGS